MFSMGNIKTPLDALNLEYVSEEKNFKKKKENIIIFSNLSPVLLKCFLFLCSFFIDLTWLYVAHMPISASCNIVIIITLSAVILSLFKTNIFKLPHNLQFIFAIRVRRENDKYGHTN